MTEPFVHSRALTFLCILLVACHGMLESGNQDPKMQFLVSWKDMSADNSSSLTRDIKLEEALCESCAAGNLEHTKFLIKFEGAGPSYDDSRPLLLAAINGQIEIVKFFMKQKWRHDQSNCAYAARKTISRGHMNIVRILLDAINEDCRRVVSGLILKALRKQQVEIFEMLLKRFKAKMIPWETISTECIYRDNIKIFRTAMKLHRYENPLSLFMSACEQFAGAIAGHILGKYQDIQFEDTAERLIDLMILDVEDAITPSILSDDRFQVSFDSEQRLLPKLIQSDRLSSIRTYLRKDGVDFQMDNLMFAFANNMMDSSDKENELFRLLLAHSSNSSKFMLYSEPFANHTIHFKLACLGHVSADNEKFSSIFGELTSSFGLAEFAVRCALRNCQWELVREALHGLFANVNSLTNLWKWQEERLYDTLELCSKSIRKSGNRRLLLSFLEMLFEESIPYYTTYDVVAEHFDEVIQKARDLRLTHLETVTNGFQGYMILTRIFSDVGLNDISKHVLDYHLHNLLIR